jgi:A/G-specific adenine glycosylase
MTPPTGAPAAFADALIDWQLRAGRHDLPWQRTRDAYRIWVSEIMLQQTQVSTVLGYYDRFLGRFPDVGALAAAPLDDVLRAWSGLGYYTRARNLHACARAVVARHGGVFPAAPQALEALPGIGRSTAAAIAAFAHGVRAPILDGNVRRVLARAFGVEGFPGERAVEARLWAIAERELPTPGEGRIEAYTQGLMDLGATVCVRARPRCDACPVAARCVARGEGRVDALPTPRPARASGVRQAAFALVRAGDAVLLERRPVRGLWGGLWSLPEPVAPAADAVLPTDGESVARWVGDRLGLRPAGAALPHREVRHAFTHFRLRAQVWSIEVAAADAPPGHEWLVLSQAGDAPLPRPIGALLESVRAGAAIPAIPAGAPTSAGATRRTSARGAQRPPRASTKLPVT